MSEILAAVVFVVALPLMASVVVYRMVLISKRKQLDPANEQTHLK